MQTFFNTIQDAAILSELYASAIVRMQYNFFFPTVYYCPFSSCIPPSSCFVSSQLSKDPANWLLAGKVSDDSTAQHNY